MILFVGQVGTGMKGREAFQEVDYRAVFGPLAKWAAEIEHADRIPEIVARAFAVALTRSPGPGGGGAARGHADRAHRRQTRTRGARAEAHARRRTRSPRRWPGSTPPARR